jgi:hypothetical protein
MNLDAKSTALKDFKPKFWFKVLSTSPTSHESGLMPTDVKLQKERKNKYESGLEWMCEGTVN